MSIKKEFIIERQGKPAVLYAGLLELAHDQGLCRITTSLLQKPSDDNGNTAICYAEVETSTGTYTGIGDANPGNVARPMVPAIIRMAETRAKARALRDAVNVGVVALEELADDDAEPAPARNNVTRMEVRKPADVEKVASTVKAQAAPAKASAQPATGDRASAAQVKAIYSIARNLLGWAETETDERTRTKFGLTPDELSKQQASGWITELQGGSK